jgi:hypothetical protein
MKSLRWGTVAFCAVLVLVAFTAACRSTYVVVPAPGDGYTAADTLWGFMEGGEQVRVVFRFDTVTRTRVDTVLRIDTVRATVAPPGARPPIRRGDDAEQDAQVRVDTVIQVDTVLRVDTVRVGTVDPDGRRAIRVDTVRVTDPRVQVDTVVRVDTVRIPGAVQGPDTVRIVVTDTVARVDTVQRVVTDTVVRTETIRLPGRRMLFVPPGQYPPQGQCRVWIHDRPPGQQASPAACDALGEIPAGAFILFGGEAWDFDYDWIGEAEARPGSVPPQILAVVRPGRR